jgi:hypothetical protein
MHLQSSRKGCWEKQNKPRAPERKAFDHDIAVVSVEQDNFGHLGMSQVQAAYHHHVRPNVAIADFRTRGQESSRQ